MSVMIAPLFDTLKYVERLQDAGVPERQAKAEAEVLRDALSESLVTVLAGKEDIRIAKDELQGEIRAFREDLQGQIRVVKEELQGEIRAFREDLQGQIRVVKEELQDEIRTVREDLQGQIRALKEELQGEIRTVREDLQGQIGALKEELHGEIRAIKEDIRTLQEETRAIRADMKAMEMKLTIRTGGMMTVMTGVLYTLLRLH